MCTSEKRERPHVSFHLHLGNPLRRVIADDDLSSASPTPACDDVFSGLHTDVLQQPMRQEDVQSHGASTQYGKGESSDQNWKEVPARRNEIGKHKAPLLLPSPPTDSPKQNLFKPLPVCQHSPQHPSGEDCSQNFY